MRRRHVAAGQRGLTLIEILVVLIIIGVMINFAVLSVGPNKNAQAEEEIHRLAALIGLASQEAVLGSREIVLELDEQGYRFFELDVTENKLVAIDDDDKLLRERSLPEGFRLSIELEGDTITLGESNNDKNDKKLKNGKTAPAARIYLLSSGEFAQPFELTLQASADGDIYRLKGEPSGKLELIYPNNT
ncbi:MAG: proteinral secretion pathway protein H [Gammaproteobacteria bacterium]|nr:MAG: proteinral secretion pathway protein H [Gammaproteobacteria bacterium]TND02461.1 MAG: proteinral secretion pathway protein H [Gammaproteobacteria bacterium]